MTENLLTIALDGDITLLDFSTALSRFRLLVHALSNEVAGKRKVVWRVEELNAGSALATVRGESREPQTLERVIQAFASVGEALQAQQPIAFSEPVRRYAHNLQRVVKRSIQTMRLETPFSDALIVNGHRTSEMYLAGTDEPRPPTMTYAYGQLRGTVQTLSSRRGLKFTLYDVIFDKPISCYLSAGQEELMRGAWGEHVTVSGLIGREPYQKRPVVIRQITQVDILKDVTAGSYRYARGAIPYEEGGEKPEVIIRGIRDAW
jgi:hypothetical protein